VYLLTVLFCLDLQYLGAIKYFISIKEYNDIIKISSEGSFFHDLYTLSSLLMAEMETRGTVVA